MLRWWVSIALLIGCSKGPEVDCQNGVDDDRDGLADKFDSDCSSTPTDDTDEDTTGGGVDGGPFVHDGLEAMELQVSVAIFVRQIGGTLDEENPFCNDVFKICDCTLNVLGNGAFVEGEGNVGLFFGEWYLESTDCNETLEKAIWYEQAGTKVWHTFTWASSGGVLDEWVAHLDESKSEPIPEDQSPSENKQFYASQMSTPYNAENGTADYEESGSTDDPGSMTTTYVTTTFAVDFN